MASISSPGQSPTPRESHISPGVTPRWTCHCALAVCVCLRLCLLLLLLVTTDASLNCIRAEMAFWVLDVRTGGSAFVGSKSRFHPLFRGVGRWTRPRKSSVLQVPCTCGPSSIHFLNLLMLLWVTYTVRQERHAGIKKSITSWVCLVVLSRLIRPV